MWHLHLFYFLKWVQQFYSSLGTNVVTNAPLADITTESLFSFDLKNGEEINEYRKLKHKMFLTHISDNNSNGS